MAGPLRRFGDFEFNLDTLELSRNGRTCRLQPQPARVLATLVANAGRVVTRDELRLAVWRDDTFVDFDRGLNFCIAQIRAALRDTPDAPRFVRTLPKRGYEFIGPVEVAGEVEPAPPVAPAISLPERKRPIAIFGWMAAAMLLLAAAGATVLLFRRTPPPIVAVARFDNETGDAVFTRFSDQLTSEVIDQLTSNAGGRFGVVGNAAILRVDRNARDLLAIGRALGARYVILGQVQRDSGGRLRVLAHLIRLPDQTHVSVSRTDGLSDNSLPTVDDIAAKIAETFVKRLNGQPAAASVAPVSTDPRRVPSSPATHIAWLACARAGAHDATSRRFQKRGRMLSDSSRRRFLTVATLSAPVALASRYLEAAPAAPIEMLYPTQSPELVQEMVVVAHSDLARVTELVTRQPTLAKATWDWGFGDWETALGAASHVGRRDIADVLLAHGAHPTIFSAAMRGELDVVKAFVAVSPAVVRTRGPHSIPLLAHAKAGGPAAAAVVAYLQTIQGSDSDPATPLADADVASIVGTYPFGRTPADRFEISASKGQVQMQRPGRFGRGLVHLGQLVFYPVGAESVRIAFAATATGTTLEIRDPDVVLSATRAK